MQRPFRYLADPLCIASLILYAANRFYLKPNHIGGWFTHGYLNGVLCLPLFVPIILYIQHLTGVRPHYRFPRLWEILQIFAVFTVVFQWWVPKFPRVFVSAHDPYDILAYFAGGILAWLIWSSKPQGATGRNIFWAFLTKRSHRACRG
jgi:hypothetical protein